ncbi:MAG TPA: hypothetical protein VK840_06360 [Candidatus Dormibacteraeota bacterium]|nr:hypothetical protein [Candidatus Dormibacteraeota bacterium]
MAANAIAPPKNLFIFPIGDAQLAQVDCDFPAFLLKNMHRLQAGQAVLCLPRMSAMVRTEWHGLPNCFCAAERITLAAARRFFHAPVNARTTRFHFEQTRRRA